jgi:outer membrane protein assembly factor BamB
VVYFGSFDNHLYAVDAETGQEKWRFTSGGEETSSPSVAGGVVYFGSHDQHLYAVDIHTGEEKWRFQTGNWVV